MLLNSHGWLNFIRKVRTVIELHIYIEEVKRKGLGTQGDDRTPPLPISSDFFSTFLDVSDSDPRSLMKV